MEGDQLLPLCLQVSGLAGGSRRDEQGKGRLQSLEVHWDLGMLPGAGRGPCPTLLCYSVRTSFFLIGRKGRMIL